MKILRRRVDVPPTATEDIRPVDVFTAWRSRMRVQSATKHLEAQIMFVDAVADLWSAFTAIDRAREQHTIQATRLEQIDTITAAVVRQLNNDLLKVQEEGKDLHSKAVVRGYEREMEEGDAKRKYEEWKGIKTTDVPPETEKNKEEEELGKELGLAEQIRKAQAEYATAYREAVQNAGGEDKLTDEEREQFRQMKAVLDQMIKDAGFQV